MIVGDTSEIMTPCEFTNRTQAKKLEMDPRTPGARARFLARPRRFNAATDAIDDWPHDSILPPLSCPSIPCSLSLSSTMSSFTPPNKQEPRKRVVRVVTKRTTRSSTTEQESSSSLVPPLCLLTILMVLWIVYKVSPTMTQYFHRTQSSPIVVFDNVLNPQTCSRLHEESAKRLGRNNDMFSWPIPLETPNNNVERVIDSILKELYQEDSQFIVEYWVRQEWHHTVAHADLDERYLDTQGILQHPYKGHVLYVTKGNEVNGPTVVFPNTTRGGEMYTRDTTEMLVVPFVDGRLLQFDGHLLHAVPRPANLWMHPISTPPIHDPPSIYGRSVVLFNLWSDPPMGLEYSSPTKMDETSAVHQDDDKLHCNRKSTWRSAHIARDYEESLWDSLWKPLQKFQMPLMGTMERRGTRPRDAPNAGDGSCGTSSIGFQV